MQSVIVSVKLKGQAVEYDLEVPAEVPSRKLAELITRNINPQAAVLANLTLRCLGPGPGRLLPLDMSLAQAGLWDGAQLEIGSQNDADNLSWHELIFGWVPIYEESQPGPPMIPAPPAPRPVTPPAPPPAPLPRPDKPIMDDGEVEWIPLTAAPRPNHPTPDEADDGWKPA